VGLWDIASRYGFDPSTISSEWSEALVEAFKAASPETIAQWAKDLGVTSEQFVKDVLYIANAFELTADAIEETRKALEDLIAQIRQNIEDVRATIYKDSTSAGEWAKAEAKRIADRITALTNLGSEEDLLTASELLSQWYSVAKQAVDQEVAARNEASELLIQVADRLESLVDSIDSVIQSITYSVLNTALPTAKAETAKQDWETLRAEVITDSGGVAEGVTVKDIEDFVGFAQTYLGEAQAAYKSSDKYQEIYASVMADLKLVKDTAEADGYEAAILKEATLQRLRTKLFLLEIDTLVDFTRLRESNMRQYMREPKLVRILGEKGSQVYKDAVNTAKKESLLAMQGEEAYRKEYNTIPIEGERFYKDKESGDIQSEKIEGRSFLQILPEYLDPEMDVRYQAAPDLPVSKALDAQRFSEVYQSLVKNQSYDPAKLGAELLRVNGKDADEFKAQGQGESVPSEDVADIQKLVDLASQENEDMMNGTDVLSTPYATSKHTEIHYAFMESPDFVNEKDLTIMSIFTQHVLGEAKAQKQRGEASIANAPVGADGGVAPQGVDPTLKSLLPDQIQGGGEVESLEPPRRNR